MSDQLRDDLAGRVAFVTGAAQGIGRATALLLAERGASVAVVDVQPGPLNEVAEVCRSMGAQAVACSLDVRDSAQVAAAVARVNGELGRLDVMANVAGIFPFASIVETSDELWNDVITTNLTGTFYCCRAALPIMLQQGSGSIVNIASGAAVRGLSHLSAYGASKAGVIAFSRALAIEAAPTVRVNVVAPGPVTAEPRDAAASSSTPGTAGILTDVPLGRTGQPHEIAEMIAFLASDRAAYVHGQVIHVNGGRVMP